MANPFFRFKKFVIHHDRCAMKVTTDGCLFGAWCARLIHEPGSGFAPGTLPSLLDIGTGSALLSLMIRQETELAADAVEIEKDAAQQAGENIRDSPWLGSVQIIREDIRFLSRGKQYDFIVSNPPFYENELPSGHLKKNIAHHSHQLSFSELLTVIKTHLKPEGRFFLLLPYKRKKEMESLLEAEGLYPEQAVIVRQSVKHDPFRIMIMGSRIKTANPSLSELAIRDEGQEYTAAFRNLLKPYYLYL